MGDVNTISVVCNCGKKLKAPASAAGRKARCPACGATVVLPGGAAAPVPVAAMSTKASAPKRPIPMPAAPRPVPVPASIPDDDEPGLNDLYDLAEPQAGTSTIESGTRCPQCNSLMDDGAVLCMNCGYDTRTGKALSPVAVSPSSKSAKVTAVKKGKKPTDMMAPQGSFVVGLVTSAALALAASVVWILVAWATGYAIGYIAILIGAAAGTGMKTGQKGFSSAGGMVAAGMTVGAILFAKLAVVEILLSQKGMHVSVFDLDAAKLGFYLFSPISLIFMVIGMGAAYRTANGSVSG